MSLPRYPSSLAKESIQNEIKDILETGSIGVTLDEGDVTIVDVNIPAQTTTLNTTDAQLVFTNAGISSIDSKLNTLGQKLSASSVPCVLSSDQSTISVNDAQLVFTNAGISSIDSKLNTLGQKLSASSVPCVLSSDQSTISVNDSQLVTTNSNLSLINDNISNVNARVYEEKIYNFKNVYQSNYKGMRNTDDKLFREDEVNNANSVTYSTTGLNIDTLNQNDNYKRICRFFSYTGGRQLYVYSMHNTQYSGGTQFEFTIEFGLEAINGHQLKFLILCSVPNTPTIKISIDTFNGNGSTISFLIPQASWNIDVCDGSGRSGYTYFGNWSSNKFYIMEDADNLHYTFGLIDGVTLIPCHSFSQNDVIGEFFNGGETQKYRAYMYLNKDDAQVANRGFLFQGFQIYSDVKPTFYSMYNFNGGVGALTTSTTPLFSLRMRDSNEYRGNILANDVIVYCDKRIRFRIRYGVNGGMTLTGSSFNNENNLQMDASATSFSGGDILYGTVLDAGTTRINLSKILDFKLFGWNNDFTDRNLLTFTGKNIDISGGTVVVDWEFNFWQI